MMKFFSIEKMKDGALRSIQRYPFVLATALTATICAIIFIERSFENNDDYDLLLNGMLIAFLGISFMIALTTISERLKLDTLKSIGLHAIGLVMLVGYYFWLPDDFPDGPAKYIIAFVLLGIASHLLVSFGAFYTSDDINAFWQFNKSLLIQAVLSAVYSGVLFAGLAIAIGAIDVLFDANIDEKRYLQLFFLVLGLFNTTYFLSGIPRDIEELKEHDDYPKELRIFSQYLLIPLVTVYIVILYAYTGKIIIQWSWPTGWVANLVLSFSIVGILSMLLLHPIKDKMEHKWINSFTKYFFYSLIPLVVLLMMSIYVRISEYGVTVLRFFVATLAVWLVFNVIYFIISKKKNIKVIPISLFIAVLLAAIGPLNAFTVSERNQVGRLEELLEKNGILESGFITKTENEIEFDDQAQISSIVSYLVDYHGEQSLQDFYEEPIDSVLADIYRGSLASQIVSTMGFQYVTSYQTEAFQNDTNTYVLISEGYGRISFELDGYDWLLNFNQYGSAANQVNFELNDEEFWIDLVEDKRLVIGQDDEEWFSANLSAYAEQVIELPENRYEMRLDSDEFVIEDETDQLEILIRFNRLVTMVEEDEFKVTQIESVVLISLKDD